MNISYLNSDFFEKIIDCNNYQWIYEVDPNSTYVVATNSNEKLQPNSGGLRISPHRLMLPDVKIYDYLQFIKTLFSMLIMSTDSMLYYNYHSINENDVIITNDVLPNHISDNIPKMFNNIVLLPHFQNEIIFNRPLVILVKDYLHNIIISCREKVKDELFPYRKMGFAANIDSIFHL